MKKFLLIIITFFLFCTIGGCNKKEVMFKYSLINTILGEEKVLEIESELKINSIEILNESSEVLDITVNDNEVKVKGIKLGSERVKCLINEKYEISITINVVGEKIYLNEFLNKSEETYYIFFYKDNCKACIDTLPYALQYEFENFANEDKKIYFCKFEAESLEFIIHRSYLGDFGEGDSKKSKVTGVESVDELYIYSVPTIIEVKDDSFRFIADGVKDVTNFIERLKRSKKNDD